MLNKRGKDLCPSKTVCRLQLFDLIFDFDVPLHATVSKIPQDPREPSLAGTPVYIYRQVHLPVRLGNK